MASPCLLLRILDHSPYPSHTARASRHRACYSLHQRIPVLLKSSLLWRRSRYLPLKESAFAWSGHVLLADGLVIRSAPLTTVLAARPSSLTGMDAVRGDILHVIAVRHW